MIQNYTKNFINGIRFEEISNVVRNIDRHDELPTGIRHPQIIFCKAEGFSELFSELQDKPYDVILISHCSDHAVTKEVFETRSPNVKKWFAQNVDFEHSDLIPIPMGIENHEGSNRGKYTDFQYLDETIKPLEISNKIINKIYCNFNNTHWNRPAVHNILRSANHFMDQGRPFKQYIENMQRFLFVASPRGNGIDCHRTWEALYAGCIPIVERHFMYDGYNLPIVQIDRWEDVDTPLNEFIEQYKSGHAFANVEQLDVQWWFNKIQEELK